MSELAQLGMCCAERSCSACTSTACRRVGTNGRFSASGRRAGRGVPFGDAGGAGAGAGGGGGGDADSRFVRGRADDRRRFGGGGAESGLRILVFSFGSA